MRYALLSDIHGNIYALKECLKIIDQKNIDEIIWVGDYVTDFPNGHDVIELVRSYELKYKCYIIRGNRDQKIIDYKNGKDFYLTEKSNVEFTYNCLKEDDIKWLESLPEKIIINAPNNKLIYVTHKCVYDFIENCRYKVSGHIHKQSIQEIDNVKYINPGSIGINTDGCFGAQFILMEITNNSEKFEKYKIEYDTTDLINNLRKTPIYNDNIKWGRLLEAGVLSGKDYPDFCVEEYKKLLKDNNIEDNSLDCWKIAFNKTMSNPL